MIIERVWPSGAWSICQTLNGRLIRQTLFGYTKKEAIQQFKQFIKESV